MPQTRIWTTRQIAHRLGKSESWVRRHRIILERQGFPPRDPLLGGWAAESIDRWLDGRFSQGKEKEKTNHDILSTRAKMIANE